MNFKMQEIITNLGWRQFCGEVVSAGLYLCVLQVGNTKQTKKMSFIK